MNRRGRRAAARLAAHAPASPRGGAIGPAAGQLNEAMALHREGQLDRAEAAYRGVLARTSDHPDALHLLGVVLCQRGRREEALALIDRAIAAGGEMPPYLSSRGIALRTLGRLDESIASYRRAIARAPDFADAHTNLANALLDKGEAAEAAVAYERALALNPGSAAAWLNLAQARKAEGRIDDARRAIERALSLAPKNAHARRTLGELALAAADPKAAEAAFREATTLSPGDSAAWDGLGVALQKLLRVEEAILAHRRAVAADRSNASAHNNLAIALESTGAHAEALESYRAALAINPDSPEAHNNLGNACREVGDRAGASEAYRRAIALRPNFAEAHNNLGVMFAEDNRLAEAVRSFERATRLKPDYAHAHNNLGNALQKQGLHEDALGVFGRAIAYDPGYAEARFNRAASLKAVGRLDQAAEEYARAVAAKPSFADAHINLGAARQDQGRIEDAVQSFRAALALAPESLDARNNLGVALMLQGRIDESEETLRQALAQAPATAPRLASVHSNLLFAMTYNGAHDTLSLFAEHRRWDERHGGAHRAVTHANEPEPERRLRVGYVSPDFWGHAVAFFFLPLLAAHDRAAVETYCYAEVDREDDITGMLKTSASSWRSTVGLDDESVAEMIRRDGIDILVDLAGHTRRNRLPALARKPAPVQVTYLGYPTTTGMSAIDYKLVDGHIAPPETRERFREELVRLPGCFVSYQPAADSPAVKPPPALSTGGVTFGSFNNAAKVTPAAVALWTRVLDAAPGSRLVLKTKAFDCPATRDRYARMFAAHGIGAGRIELCGHIADPTGHLRHYHEIDIALDPFPYNGGTTSLEGLWMGVPVVTFVGDRIVHRFGLSFLAACGLTDLAASNAADYVRIAAELARDRDRLTELRAGLRDRMATSPLTDHAGLARNVERAYRAMWRRWCADRRARA